MEFIIKIDHQLFEFLNSTLTHPWLDVFFPFVTDLYKSIFFQLTVYPAVLFFFIYHYRKKSWLIFLSLVLCIATSDFIGSQFIKNNVNRLRPGDNPEVISSIKSPYGGTSFISNHAANTFAFAAFMIVFFPLAKIPLYFIAILIAYSRIYVGVHFPLDVLGGALFGFLIGKLFAFTCVSLFKINKDKQISFRKGAKT